jgi:hypothetical protein
VRDCFRDGEFEDFHSQLAELDDDAVEAIMKDAVNRTHVLPSNEHTGRQPRAPSRRDFQSATFL